MHLFFDVLSRCASLIWNRNRSQWTGISCLYHTPLAGLKKWMYCLLCSDRLQGVSPNDQIEFRQTGLRETSSPLVTSPIFSSSFSLFAQRKRSKGKGSPINLRRDRQRLAALFFPNSPSLRSGSDSGKNGHFACLSVRRLTFQGIPVKKPDRNCLPLISHIYIYLKWTILGKRHDLNVILSPIYRTQNLLPHEWDSSLRLAEPVPNLIRDSEWQNWYIGFINLSA